MPLRSQCAFRCNIDEDTEWIRQIPNGIIHPLRQCNGHIEMPVMPLVGNRLNARCTHSDTLEERRIHIGKIEGEGTPVVGGTRLIERHLREIEDDAVTRRRARGTQSRQGCCCRCIGGQRHEDGDGEDRDFLKKFH